MNNVQQYRRVPKYTRNSEAKKEQILTAFADLVRKKGYPKITIRDIAEEAETSVGIIYRYYPAGKPEITSKLYESYLLSITPSEIDTDSPGSLEDEIRRHLKMHADNAALYRAFDVANLENHDIFAGSKRTRDTVLSERYQDKEKMRRISLNYAVVDALVHRHVLLERITETNEELVELLVRLVKGIQSK
jgi:AcrR family transcriptional regulator